MSQKCILTGMVIKAMPVNEFDKRIVLLTLERGKVTAFARGARRPKSAMQAATNLFCFGTFEAYEGKDSYTVVKADISNYFREMSSDYEVNCYGCYLLELADYFCQNENDCKDQLKLVYQSLRALLSPSFDNRLVRRIYELKTLCFYGVAPNVFSCASCGSKEKLKFFSMSKKGVVCSDCSSSERYILNDAAVYALQYIEATPVEKLYSFSVKDEVLEMLEDVIGAYLRIFIDKELKTVMFLPD